MLITLKLQLILFLISLSIFTFLITMIVKYKLELKYTLLWLLLNVIVIVFAIAPRVVEMASSLLDIETPVNTLYLFAIIGLALIVFSMTITISRLSDNLKNVSQELGLYKKQLEDTQALQGDTSKKK